MKRDRYPALAAFSGLLALLSARTAAAESPADPAPSPQERRLPEPDRAEPTKPAATPTAVCGNARELTLPIGADFLPYVGTSSAEAMRDGTRNISFNLVGGLSSGLRGVELGGVVNIERRYACGVQVAGVSNVVLGPVRGISLSGVVNVSAETAGAVQVAGVANITKGELDGAQISGVVNYVRADVSGFQLAGVANLGARVDGAQVAGAVNLSLGEVHGVQLAPINVTTGSVRGVQIGVVNIAEKSDFSLGLVSINTRGRTHVDAWAAPEVGLFASAVKHGGDHWHGIYGFGTRADDGKFLAILGFGGHAVLNERLRLDLDVLGYEAKPFQSRYESSLLQARALLGVRLLDALSVFAGPSYNVLLSRRGASDAAPSYAREVGKGYEPNVHLWPGAVIGLQLLSDAAG